MVALLGCLGIFVLARALAGSCEVPLGAYAEIRAGKLWLRGFVALPDGSRIVRAELVAVVTQQLSVLTGEIGKALKAMGYAGPVGMEAFAKGDEEAALEAFRTAFTV